MRTKLAEALAANANLEDETKVLQGPGIERNPNEASMTANAVTNDELVASDIGSMGEATDSSSIHRPSSSNSSFVTMAFTCGHSVSGPKFGDAVAEFLSRVGPLGAPIAAAIAADEYVRAAREGAEGLVTLPCPACCAAAMLSME